MGESPPFCAWSGTRRAPAFSRPDFGGCDSSPGSGKGQAAQATVTGGRASKPFGFAAPSLSFEDVLSWGPSAPGHSAAAGEVMVPSPRHARVSSSVGRRERVSSRERAAQVRRGREPAQATVEVEEAAAPHEGASSAARQGGQAPLVRPLVRPKMHSAAGLRAYADQRRGLATISQSAQLKQREHFRPAAETERRRREPKALWSSRGWVFFATLSMCRFPTRFGI